MIVGPGDDADEPRLFLEGHGATVRVKGKLPRLKLDTGCCSFFRR